MDPSRGAHVRGKAADAVVAVAEAFRDAAGDVVRERLTRPKYGHAQDVAMDVLDKRIAQLTAKTKHGEKPTQKDSQTIELLKDIKSEMQRAFDERWNDRDRGDWRSDREITGPPR